MRDPHVEALYYSADSECEGFEYRNPAPIEWDAERARYQLEDGKLTAWPKDHHASIEEAKSALCPELEAWEASVDLMHGLSGLGRLRFRYSDAELIDRDPPPPGSGVVSIGSALECSSASMVGRGKIFRGHYPTPPLFDRIDTEIVRDLMARYRQWQAGREPFAAMAYAVLTRIEIRAGSRKQAAKRYNISKKVLDRLGELVSTGQGEPLEVRKFAQEGYQPMNLEDREWLQKVISTIIIQVAVVEAGDAPKLLTMAPPS